MLPYNYVRATTVVVLQVCISTKTMGGCYEACLLLWLAERCHGVHHLLAVAKVSLVPEVLTFSLKTVGPGGVGGGMSP